jgi:acyl-CoA synthetase (NDP forming)/GNAT superfamily N-acetyltransferase
MDLGKADHVYALLADGTTVEIRPAGPGDFDAVKSMLQQMSPNNTYMRFFNVSRLAAEEEARRICRAPGANHGALLALCGDEVVGVASFYVTENEDPESGAARPGAQSATGPGGGHTAEIAFAVADRMHHKGIATLLLEHLVSLARRQQITTFTADTLTENKRMQDVFAAAGLPMIRRYSEGVYKMTFPLPAAGPGTALDSYLSAVTERERRAETASLRHVLAPESVVVIGASRRRGTVGRAILDNIRAGGYAGRLYTVNARARQIDGERVLSSVGDLPEPADLAVIAVPAAAVLDVAEQCGKRGVRSMIVITSGLDTAACADLLAVCRRHGMRLVGPDCFGVAVPAIGLDATFAANPPEPGVAGLVMESGGLGFAMVDQLSRLGIGISSFASVGNKLDVSSNDMLLWWEHDGVTRLAVLYIESFGNPRKFARTARRVSVAMPVLAVRAARPPAGPRTTAPGTPLLVSRDALFEQAGIITVRGYGELIEATALLATQPVPAGQTVAIISNVGSAGELAAGACTDLGLTVYRPHGQTGERLRVTGTRTSTESGPVETMATVSAEDFRTCLELLAADDDVHAIIAIVLPTGATGDLLTAIQEADVTVPLAAVVLNQTESVRVLPRPGRPQGPVPAYGYPEAAVGAVARAAGYGAWRAEPRGQVPDFPDVRAADARLLIREFLRESPAGGWLAPGQAAALVSCYGIPVAAGDEEAAAWPGTEVIVTVAADQMFGPLVVFGLGGVATEVFADQAARLTPLTDVDADRLIRSPRSAPLLLGGDGRPAADLAALRDLLLRVSRLADDLADVTELDLRPVIAGPAGVLARHARVRLAPYEPQDPFLRRLR